MGLRRLADVRVVSPLRPLALDPDLGLGGLGDDAGTSARAVAPLQRLALVDCGLAALPRGVAALASLVAIDASHNPELGANSAGCLPAGLAALPGLAELRLAHCGLGSLPAVVWELPRLTRLDVAGNPLAALPRGAPVSAGRLEALDLSGTRLRALPAWLPAAGSLRELAVGAAALAGAPPCCGAAGPLSKAAAVVPSGGVGGACVSAALGTLAIDGGAGGQDARDPGGWLRGLLGQLPGLRRLRVEGATWEAAAVKALMSLLTAPGGCGGLRIELVP
jgi:Leucine-rich repeat (LRR) protein